MLKPGACFMLVTYGDPSARLFYLQSSVLHWDIQVFVVSKPARACRESVDPGEEVEGEEEGEEAGVMTAARNPIKGPFNPEQQVG